MFITCTLPAGNENEKDKEKRSAPVKLRVSRYGSERKLFDTTDKMRPRKWVESRNQENFPRADKLVVQH
jgi:hypothetical protein